MSLGSFFSREFKLGEAAVINSAANALANNATELESLVEAAAPQGVSAVVAAVEKFDAKLGVGTAALINMTLATYEPQLTAQLAGLIAEGGPLVANVASAMKLLAQKLQAEALATV